MKKIGIKIIKRYIIKSLNTKEDEKSSVKSFKLNKSKIQALFNQPN